MFDLRLTNVSKKYRIRGVDEPKRRLSLRQRIRRLRARPYEFWALQRVSFEVTRGQAFGIIGPNGAGKSTILKLLSSITTPTSGEIAIRGRLSALIEVGSGFHPDLTGRENIFLSGAILGMRRREISEKLESIVEFAGVNQFIDTPVKRYSSGMYVRLGFSIAAHLESDILLLDEVLAVGDSAFQSRCFDRIGELRSAGKTIVFISHDLTAVERLCDSALLLEKGTVREVGRPREIIVSYEKRSSATELQLNAEAGEFSKPIRITKVTCADEAGRELASCCGAGFLMTRLEYEAREDIQDVVFEVLFYSADNNFYGKFTTAADEIDLETGSGFVEFFCADLRMPAGLYLLDATVSRRGGEEIEWQYRCASLSVEAKRSAAEAGCLPSECRVIQHKLSQPRKQVNGAARPDSIAALQMKGRY